MSLKNILCAAALAAMTASPALAVPMINLDDTGTGVATLQVILDAPGSIGAEIGVTLSGGLTLTSATIANATEFDTENPGDSPFIAGSVDGGDAMGLNVNTGAGEIFAAYGGPGTAAGTYDFLTINYTGSGTISADGYVAQLGVLGSQLTDELTIGPGGLIGDTNDDGAVSTLDIDPFVLALTNPSAYDAMWPGIRVQRADINQDTVVNTLDIDPFVNLLTGGAPSAGASAAPEPTTAVLLLTGVAMLGAARRRS